MNCGWRVCLMSESRSRGASSAACRAGAAGPESCGFSFARSSRAFSCFRKSASYFRRSLSLTAAPFTLSGLRTKNPSRMYQVYSRCSPQSGTCAGPRSSTRSRSSRMYCWSFFQLSSRRARTSLHEGIEVRLGRDDRSGEAGEKYAETQADERHETPCRKGQPLARYQTELGGPKFARTGHPLPRRENAGIMEVSSMGARG